MNARGEKEQTRYISNTGFNYFSQLGDVSKARCFVLRAGTWLGGNPGPPLAGRSPLQLSSSRSASIIDLKGKRGGSHTQGSRRFWEERQTSSRKKVASAGCPAWRIFCEWKGTKCKAVCCYSDLEEKRERGRGEREKEKGLTFGARLGCCILLLLFLLLLLQLPVLPSGKASPPAFSFNWDCIVCDRFRIYAQKFIHD